MKGSAWGRMGFVGADWAAAVRQSTPMTTLQSKSLLKLARMWRDEVMGEFG
jgi:hypothetical protein